MTLCSRGRSICGSTLVRVSVTVLLIAASAPAARRNPRACAGPPRGNSLPACDRREKIRGGLPGSRNIARLQVIFEGSKMSKLSTFPITRRWPPKHADRLQLYSLPTPNGVKVSIALEEMGLPYEAHAIDIGRNESWTAEF